MAYFVLCLLLLGIFKATYSEMLSAHVSLSWTIYNDSITFRIAAKTLGWAAIGLNNEPQMKGADMVLCGLKSGKGYVYDLHDPKGHERPVMDSHQDYKQIWVQENGTHTFCTVRRLLNTNDPKDYVITEKPAKVLWAINEKDADSSDKFVYHGPSNRGVKEILLLDPDHQLTFKSSGKSKVGKNKEP